MAGDDGQLQQVAPLGDEAAKTAVAAVRKLAHDVNNALVSAASTLDLLVIDNPDLESVLAPVRHELMRPRALFERPMRGLPTRAMVRPWTLADWRAKIADEAKGVGVSVRMPSDLPKPADLDEGQWVQCLDNLVRNALDAHAVAARTAEQVLAGGRWVAVQAHAAGGTGVCEVTDNSGIGGTSAAVQDRKPRSGGGHLGLGLAVAAAHIAAAGGSLQAGPLGDGWMARLQWPLGN